MPHTKGPWTNQQAVKDLRRHFGDTQQQFAKRIGLSLRAIANYEKDRIPAVGVLAWLAMTADIANRPDLSAFFIREVKDQLGPLEDWPMFASYADPSPRAFLAINTHGDDQVQFLADVAVFLQLFLGRSSQKRGKSRIDAKIHAARVALRQLIQMPEVETLRAEVRAGRAIAKAEGR